ncbi:MAG: hypothetical protein AB7P40_23400 [Chloroflexota bacterium]
MSDFAIAGLLLALLVSLAVAAPIWGADSRDSIESDEAARRVAWMHGGSGGFTTGAASGQGAPLSVNVSLASWLRIVAHRLDADA